MISKAPWTYDDACVVDSGGEEVAVLWNSEDGPIIAAAPDLLAALEDMLSGWKYIRQAHGDLYGVGWDRAQEKAEAAVKKARSE